MTTATATVIGAVGWARIVACAENRRAAQADLDTTTAEWETAKQTMNEREETEDKVLQEIEEAVGDKGSPDGESSDRLISVARDRKRAADQFVVVDRRKRQLNNTHKEAQDRLLSVIDAACGLDGALPFDMGNGAAGGARDAYKHVLLADLMGGELHAEVYVKCGLSTVGDVLKAGHVGLSQRAREGEMTDDQLEYVHKVVKEYLERRNIDTKALDGKGE